MRNVKILLVCWVLIALFSCKEVYKPIVISSTDSYLVVEGVLNAGTGPTNIRLSRTFKLDDTARLQGERNAQVTIEGKDNTARTLTMTGDGVYSSPNLALVINNEYRLRIKTAGGKEYLSDYVTARSSPVIDSISWKQDERGVQLYVDTHDPGNNTRYYRWDYDETWEIRTYYYSEFKYANGVVSKRTPGEMVATCWKYDASNSILLGSSARLQSDIIHRAPIAFLFNGDEKLDVRYSILLRQYALDKQGYEFYEMMKKNSESLGTIFDAQPSELRGNIHSVSAPGELVIGFISASEISEKRMFISRSELNRWNFYEDCPEILVKNDPDSIQAAYDGGGSIYGAVYNIFNMISYYKFSTKPCVECTARDGSLIRPSYW